MSFDCHNKVSDSDLYNVWNNTLSAEWMCTVFGTGDKPMVLSRKKFMEKPHKTKGLFINISLFKGLWFLYVFGYITTIKNVWQQIL